MTTRAFLRPSAFLAALLLSFACAPADRVEESLGELAWLADVGGEVIGTPLVLGEAERGPQVIVPTAEGDLVSLDLENGRRRWTVGLAGPSFSSPRASSGLVFAGDNGGVCRAIDPADGSTRWSFQAGHWILGSPVPAGRLVAVPSLDKHLHALDIATGREVWFFATGEPIYATPAADGPAVYVGSLDGNLYALDSSSGALAWRFPTDGWIVSEPLVLGDTIVFASDDRKVYCLRKSDGSLLWEYRMAPQRVSYTEVQKDRARAAAPLASGGTVLVASMNRHVYALDAASGKLAWDRPMSAPIWSRPALFRDALYAGDLDGSVSRLDAATGAVTGHARIARPRLSLWSQSSRDWPGDNLWASPVFSGDRMIVASASHRVYCFRVPPPSDRERE